jgi:membrane-associated HD superfamily phosphohydrolase
LSNLRSQAPDQPPKVNEVPYDVLQSLFALVAAFYLDFLGLISNQRHGIHAFGVANLAIFFLCFLAWFWFPGDRANEKDKKLQQARLFGWLVSLVAVAATLILPIYWNERVTRVFLGISLIVLLFLLRIFHKARLNQLAVEAPALSAAAPQAPPATPKNNV